MPVLISTPDISAEMPLGAAGCATGNQTCNGIMPAFTPKPTKNSRKTKSRSRPDNTLPESNVENDTDSDADARMKNAAMSDPVPTCDMTKYR